MMATPEETVLLWVMHPDAFAVPDAHDADPDTLLLLASSHRVVGRLLARFEKQLPPGLSHLFVARLRFFEHERRNRFREQISYAQSLAEQFGSPESPLIFLKGFSSYAVTADERLKRPVGDFDLMGSNLPTLYDSLIAEGYFGKRHYTHEYGKLWSGQVTIDLHEYFPVRGYPQEGWDIDPVALTLPQKFEKHQLPELPSDLIESGVYYEDLLKHSQKGIALGTEQLTFPTPEMACLILCAHAFRDVTVRFHYMGDQVLLRLGELVDVNALASAPHFDADTFVALVKLYNATDSVTWVSRQCERFFGQSFLPEFPEAAIRTALTVEHLFMGDWVHLGEPSLHTRSGEVLLERLGCKTILLEQFHKAIVPLSPVMYHKAIPNFLFQIEWIENLLILHFELENNVTSLRLLFLNDRHFICHFRDGELFDHRFKDLNLLDFITPDSEPQITSTRKGMCLEITFARPSGLREIFCFIELQTKTTSAYVPVRLLFSDAD